MPKFITRLIDFMIYAHDPSSGLRILLPMIYLMIVGLIGGLMYLLLYMII